MKVCRTAYLLACAAVAGCAGVREPQPEPVVRRAEMPPHRITIRTSPAGGIVDWNGDVLGRAPVEIEVQPQMVFGRPAWPNNGNTIQIFRARWPDGSSAVEGFGTLRTMPSQVGIVSPNYGRNPLLDALLADAYAKPNIKQRTGP